MKEGITIKRLNQFIEDFGLFIKQCYHSIAWSAEKNTESKIQKLQGQKTEEWYFYQII